MTYPARSISAYGAMASASRPRFVARETHAGYAVSPPTPVQCRTARGLALTDRSPTDAPVLSPSASEAGMPEADAVHELLKALQAIVNEVRLRAAGRERSADGERAPDPRPPLVRWSDGILSGAIPPWPTPQTKGPTAAPQRPVPAQTILYRTCPECGEATLDTAEGPVSISHERLAELAPMSNRIVIAPDDERPVPRQDRDSALGRSSSSGVGSPSEVASESRADGSGLDEPNSARLRRQVLHRDGCDAPTRAAAGGGISMPITSSSAPTVGERCCRTRSRSATSATRCCTAACSRSVDPRPLVSLGGHDPGPRP